MKTSVYSLGVLVLALAFSSLFTSCTDDWTEEQYEQLIGFRAPISSSTGVTAVYVPYSRKDTLGNFKYGSGQSSYELPVVVSEDFLAELFATIQDNPKALVEVDLPNQRVTNKTTGRSETFDINGYKKHCLMNGLDDIDFLVENKDKIEAWEQRNK